MNESEKLIKEKYEKQGYKSLRGGYPDFIFFKEDENGKIISESVFFCEVKGLNDTIKLNQYKCMEILKALGLDAKLELVEIKNTSTYNHYDDEFANEIYLKINELQDKKYRTSKIANEIMIKFNISRASFYRYFAKFNQKKKLIKQRA